MKSSRNILILLLLVCLCDAEARTGNVNVAGLIGHNAVFGVFGGGEVSAAHRSASLFQVRSALRAVSFPKYTVDLRPGLYHDFNFGRINAEILTQCSYQSTTYDVCAGISLGLQMKWVWLSLGYYHRSLLPSSGDAGLSEPLNLMYELGVSCLPDVERWDLHVIISNCRMARLERFYQPSLVICGLYCPMENLGVVVSSEYSRAGVFNISSNHYQGHLSIGVQYRW